MKVFVKEELKGSTNFKKVSEIANNLLIKMNIAETFAKIQAANMPGTSSSEIQNAFLSIATELGFRNEAKGLFSSYLNSQLRPDYYYKISDNDGILLEVERGKTTINNMDLLDFWKCHICQHANYLFLMVPKELKQNTNMKPRKEFNTVSSRMESFFKKGNYTNVDAVFLFGY